MFLHESKSSFQPWSFLLFPVILQKPFQCFHLVLVFSSSAHVFILPWSFPNLSTIFYKNIQGTTKWWPKNPPPNPLINLKLFVSAFEINIAIWACQCASFRAPELEINQGLSQSPCPSSSSSQCQPHTSNQTTGVALTTKGIHCYLYV